MKKSSSATKPSIKKSSSKPATSKPAAKIKPPVVDAVPKLNIKERKVKVTVGGLAFYPQKKAPNIFISVAAWVQAGTPSDVYVFDSVDTLKVCGIPISDGAHIKGMYRRMPVQKPKLVTVTIQPTVISYMKPSHTKTKTAGIQVAETKDHHRMNY